MHTGSKAFEQGTSKNYDVIIDCGGRALSQVYEYLKFVTRENSTYTMRTITGSGLAPLDGEEYIIAYTGYSPVKAAPFGTFAGGKLFGARGVWVENMISTDSMNYSLIDSDGATQNPPISAIMTVSSIVSGDRVSVFRTSAGTTILKNMYGSHVSSNTTGSVAFTGSSTIATDTPAVGFIRIVDNDTLAEERLAYTSWSGLVFQLGSALTNAYSGSDYAYVPLIDDTASGTSIAKTVIYNTDRLVLIRVRKKGILPFETSGTFGSAGLTVAAIRTTDAIAT